MSHHGKAPGGGVPEGNQPNGVSPDGQIPSPTNRSSQVEQKTQTNRAVDAGGGIHRGDRRDTHPSFSTGKGGRGSTAGKARDGGRSGPLGASGRKSGPKSG